MLRHLYTRFGSQYREGCVVTASFVKSGGGSPVYTKVSTRNEQSHADLSVAGAGALPVLTFPACRVCTVLNASLDVQGNTAAQRMVAYRTPNVSTGTVQLIVVDLATPTVQTPTDGDTLSVTLYLAK